VLPPPHPSPITQTTSRSAQPFLHSSRQSVVGMPGHVLSPKNCPFANGISIGSAIFAQLTSECRRSCRGMPFPVKIAPSCGRSGSPSNTWFREPSLHPRPKWHLDRFSRFCTAHRRVSLLAYFTMGRPFPSKLFLLMGNWAPSQPSTLWVKKGCHPNHGYNFVSS